MDRTCGIEGFVDRYGDRAAEAIWRGALELVKRAADDAGEGLHGRWGSLPRRELRRLRGELAEALVLAHLAVALQEERNELDETLLADVRRRADAAAAKARRQGTLEAERVRLLKHAARREGRPLAAGELWPELCPGDERPAWWP